MARKLKTFITNIGFLELALAAPSMKAALEAWGMGHNAFQHGFAKQTDDPKIVAATMAQPGVVLRRAVGTKGEFTEHSELPKDLWKLEAPKAEPIRPKVKAPAKQRAKAKPAADDKKDRAAILSFEKAKQRRDAAREKEKADAADKREKERAQIERALAKAEDALDRATAHHERSSRQSRRIRKNWTAALPPKRSAGTRSGPSWLRRGNGQRTARWRTATVTSPMQASLRYRGF
jgi:colicin import membrane protein